MSEKGPTGHIEVRRHGDKDKEGNLSPEGVQRAHSEAEKIYRQLLIAPADTIYYVVPSDVQRAQDTRSEIEKRLAELVANDQRGGIELVPFDQQGSIKKGRGKKYIVTGMPYSEQMGFNGEPYNAAFMEFNKLYGNEDLVAQTWIARKSELSAFRAEIKNRFPMMSDAEIAGIQPGKFIKTPEEVALKQLDAIIETTRTMNAANPGQSARSTYIGHAPAVDFLAMAVLGEEMTQANFARTQGLRKFLEKSTFQIENGEIVMAEFRGRSLIEGVRVSLTDLRARLQAQALERKAEWAAA